MKPFPEAVQKAFPCNLGRVAERPWWHRAPVTDAKMYRDVPTGVGEWRSAETVQEAAEMDEKHPIPHPGYRAGQIWAAEDGASVCITQFNAPTIWAGCNNGSSSSFVEAYPYLIADPACPHLAPWSPVESK